MALVRYKLYNGSNRYKMKSPSFSGKGSFVLGVALTVTENVSAHKDVTCFDGADGSITVAASGGTAPYVYSLDQNFTTTNSTGVFSGLSVSGTVYESTDQYGGIVVCHKTIYAKDANGRIGHVDVELKSPVELEWLNVPNDMTVYCDAGQNYATVDLSMIRPSTMANGYVANMAGKTPDDHYQESIIINGHYVPHKISLYAENDCYEAVSNSFKITVVPEPSLAEDTSAHHDVTCFDGGDGSITVQASGGVAPYLYSIDGTNWQSSPTFSNLAITGPVTEGTDEYGGILICTKKIYVKDANNHMASVDIQLKSPVELEWLGVQDLTFYVPDGETEIVLCYGVDFPVPYLSTTSNNAEIRNPHGTGYPTNYEIIDGQWYYHFLVNRTYDIVYEARNDCRRGVNCYFTITVLPN